MPVDTSIAPYYDDYNEDKNFHKVLFRPGVAVQARELTQAQTILQNQIKRVGDYLFTTGDKVSGSKPAINTNARTIRLNPEFLPTGGVQSLLNLYVIARPATEDVQDPDFPNDPNRTITRYTAQSEVIGQVEYVFEQNNPDVDDPPAIVINLKRHNETNNGLIAGNTELFFYADYNAALNKETPALYSNIFTFEDISKQAVGTISAFAKRMLITQGFSNLQIGDLLEHPAVTKSVYITDIIGTNYVELSEPLGVPIPFIGSEVPEENTDAITFYRNASNPTIIVTQDTSVYYKDGYFVRSELQKTVPDKNTAYPTKMIGYYTTEKIITSNDDSTLLDPAIGSSNYFAKGADRLQINLDIVSLDLIKTFVEDAGGNQIEDKQIFSAEDFIPLVRFNKGAIEFISEVTLNSRIEASLAERTYDESGSYLVDNFNVIPKENLGVDDKLYFNVSPGKGYIGGYQVKTIGPTEIYTDLNNATATLEAYNVNTTSGNYVKVRNVSGGLPKLDEIKVADTFVEAHNVVNPTDETSLIGYAILRGIEYDKNDTESSVLKVFWHKYASALPAADSWETWAKYYGVIGEGYDDLDTARRVANVLYGPSPDTQFGSGLAEGHVILSEYGTDKTPRYSLYRDPDTRGLYYYYSRYKEYNDAWGPADDPTLVLRQFVEGAEKTLNPADPSDVTKDYYRTRNKMTIYYLGPGGENQSPFSDGTSGAGRIKSLIGVANGFTEHTQTATYSAPFFYGEIDSESINPETEDIIISDPRSVDSLICPLAKSYVKGLTKIAFEYRKTFKNIVFTNGVYSRSVSAPESFVLADGSVDASLARGHFIVLLKSGTASTPAGVWDFSRGSCVISNDSKQLTINLGDPTFNGTADISMRLETDDATPRSKTLIQNYAKIIDIEAEGVYYSLGVADVLSFKGIFKIDDEADYVGEWNELTNYTYGNVVISVGRAFRCLIQNTGKSLANAEYWEAIPSENFALYNISKGDYDNYYDHGTLSFQGGSSNLPGTVIVVVDYFEHSGDGPIIATSYPSSLYESIPTFRSPITSQEFNLRDCIDFRPRRVDDSEYFDFASALTPLSFTNTEVNVEYYLKRIDRLYVTSNRQTFDSPYNRFYIERGNPAENPEAPQDNSDNTKLSICTLEVPPVTTSPFAVGIRYDENKRFTMRDLGKLETLVTELDRTVKIHTMEINILKAAITNEDTGEVLIKSGVLIEDFSDLEKADLIGGYFACAIDESDRECFPGFNAYNMNLALASEYVEQPDTSKPPTLPFAKYNDILTMKFTNETFVSQLEANSTLKVNPGAVDDGRGRAVISKKNSFVVNLLLSAGSMLMTSIALKTAAAYVMKTAIVNGVQTGVVGNLLTAYAGQSTVAAAYTTNNVLAVAWQAAREIGQPFFNAAPTIDALVQYISNGIDKVVDVGRLVYQTFERGFQPIMDIFKFNGGAGVGGGASAGTSIAGTSSSFAASNLGPASGAWTTSGLLNAGFTQISNSLGQIMQGNFTAGINGVGAGLVTLSAGIVTGALTAGAVAANFVATSLGYQAIFSQAAIQGIGGQVLAFAQSGFLAGAVTVLAAVAVVYVGVKLVKKLWKGIKKLFSDERMKEDIQFVKKQDNGLNLYYFKYKKEFEDIAGKGYRYGYLAHEVEEVYPNAVSIASNGYKCIDTRLIG